MKKLLVVFLLISGVLFADTNLPEWTKKVKNIDTRCDSETLKSKLKDIIEIGYIIKEDPSIWLNGRTLEYINAKCRINYNFITSKEILTKKVDLYFKYKKDAEKNMPFPMMESKQKQAWIETHSDWVLQNPREQEWTKNVTSPEGCKEDTSGKIRDIVTIGTNVMHEDPAIWLTGKYLEFVNSRCSLTGTYILRDTTKEDFEKLVKGASVSNEEVFKRESFFEEQKKQDDKLNLIIGIVISILIIGLFLRNDKPKKILLKKKEKSSRFWGLFWWWAIWDSINNNNKH